MYLSSTATPKLNGCCRRKFTGEFHACNGYGRDILRAAGVEDAGRFIAVASGDTCNTVAARAAKEVPGFPFAIALIYAPRRAYIYREIGIPTLASALDCGKHLPDARTP
jgi:trk system potassium uptake protein TrkA